MYELLAHWPSILELKEFIGRKLQVARNNGTQGEDYGNFTSTTIRFATRENFDRPNRYGGNYEDPPEPDEPESDEEEPEEQASDEQESDEQDSDEQSTPNSSSSSSSSSSSDSGPSQNVRGASDSSSSTSGSSSKSSSSEIELKINLDQRQRLSTIEDTAVISVLQDIIAS